MKTIAFFNNQGGVGKTTLVYHVSWMCSELGRRVLAVDFDPQATLTTMFLDGPRLETLWSESGENLSILTCIKPITAGLGDIADAPLQPISENLHLIPGDLGLSQFEDKLSDSWPRCLDQDEAAFRAVTAFYRIVQRAASAVAAEVVLLDIGPNLGAINRSSLLAADHLVMPLAPGLLSLQGLRTLGPALDTWRKNWKLRLDATPLDLNIPMPAGSMTPAGYVVMQHVERKSRPVKAYQRWVDKIPGVYERHVLRRTNYVETNQDDANRIGFVKNHHSLMSLAEDARKPIFHLRPVDGALGAHAAAVSSSYLDFKRLTQEILRRTDC